MHRRSHLAPPLLLTPSHIRPSSLKSNRGIRRWRERQVPLYSCLDQTVVVETHAPNISLFTFARQPNSGSGSATSLGIIDLCDKLIGTVVLRRPCLVVRLRCNVRRDRSMEKKACSNCRYSNNPVGYSSADVPSESDCRCPIPGFPWHIYHRYRSHETVMPTLCGHYQPVSAGRCGECGKELGPQHLVKYWACGVFSVIPCCSTDCLAAQQGQLDAERDALPPVQASTDPQLRACH